MKINLTQEQKEIVEAVSSEKAIKINAYAGTGKTTTLTAIANAYKDKRILYVAFNKSVVEEMKKKKLSNVDAKTIHSLALQHTKQDLRFDFGNIADRNKFREEIERFFYLTYEQTLVIRDVFTAFCNSQHTEVSLETISSLFKRKRDLEFRAKLTNLSVAEITEILQEIFRRILTKEFDVITHDIYMKFFHINLDRYGKELASKYDLIMIDEGQDVNGTQAGLLAVPFKRKVVVGDTHQNIYNWRDTINILSHSKDFKLYNLTTTFRFENDEILKLVNSYLNKVKHDTNTLKSIKTNKSNNLTAFISRSNARLLEKLMKAEQKVRILGDKTELIRQMRQAESILRYLQTREIISSINPFIRRLIDERELSDLDELVKILIEEAGEEELARALLLVERFDVDEIEHRIKTMHDENAKTVLSTAHTSKGLEFDTVVLLNDFTTPSELIKKFLENNPHIAPNKLNELIKSDSYLIRELLDEFNTLYVAITRAIHSLDFENYSLKKHLTDLTTETTETNKEQNKTKESQPLTEEDLDRMLGLL